MDTSIAQPGIHPLIETAPRAVGWPKFLLQIVTVAIAYLIGSLLPIAPSLIAQLDAAAAGVEPTLGSIETATSAMGGAVLGLLVAWLWLRRDRAVPVAWNFERPASWKRTLGWAALATAGTLAIFAAGGPLMQAIGLDTPDAGLILDLVTQSPLTFAVWVIGVAWLAAGLGEELLYRGFLMDRLSRLPGLGRSTWAVLAVQAVLFGLPHAYQGAGGMVVTGLVGLWLGGVFLKTGRNLWAVVLAHAAVDTISMSLAYADKLGWIAMS